jgi:hypothetical protein
MIRILLITGRIPDLEAGENKMYEKDAIHSDNYVMQIFNIIVILSVHDAHSNGACE